jgi:hypothetical protein
MQETHRVHITLKRWPDEGPLMDGTPAGNYMPQAIPLIWSNLWDVCSVVVGSIPGQAMAHQQLNAGQLPLFHGNIEEKVVNRAAVLK